MYGNGLININVHYRDALGIKSYGQSFLDLADALQLEKDYGVPFVGIGAIHSGRTRARAPRYGRWHAPGLQRGVRRPGQQAPL